MNTLFMIQKVKKIPAKGALAYFLIGVVWIFFMSVLLPQTRPELHYPHWIEILSYWIFVIFSTSGIFLVIQHYLDRSILTQEEMEESKDRFRLMAENAQDIIFRYRLSPSNQMEYISPAIAHIAGYSPEVFYDNPFQIFRLIHPKDASRLKRLLKSVELLSEPHILRWVAENGELLYLEHRTTPIQDDEGTVVVVEGIARDVTEEKKLESVRMRLASIVESAEDAIIGKDLETRITDWNFGAERLYGYTKEEIIGQPITMLFPPNSTEEIDAIMAKIRRGERVAPYETVRVTKNGEHINILFTVSPIKNPNGEIVGAAAIARDITLQNKMQEYQYRQIKIQAKQQLSKEISQQLDTNYEIIQKNGREIIHRISDHQARAAFARILETTVKGKSLTNHLLSYAMPKSGKTGYFSLPELSLHLHELGELLLPENVNITTESAKSDIQVLADVCQLQRISLGICFYLSKLLPEGGKLIFGFNTPSEGDLKIHDKTGSEYIEFNISSPNILLDEGELDRLSDPVITRRDDCLEINLPIAAAYSLLEQMGGWFDIYRHQEQGTVFSLVLPIADMTGNNYPVMRISLGAQIGVLVVDGDAAVSESVEALLKYEGFIVFTAKTGEEALKIFQKELETIELIYADLGVSGLSGLELAQEIKLINPNVHFVGATRFGEMHETDTAYLSDFFTVLQKPFKEQQLLDALIQAQWSGEMVSGRLI